MRRAAIPWIAMSAKPSAADMFVANRDMGRGAGLRQVEEFTTTLNRIRRTCYATAGALILLALICLMLFLHDVDMFALYCAGAGVLMIRIAMTGADYFREEKRAARAYWIYLDTYSFQVLTQLTRTSHLSRWSRYEVERYLSVSHLVW